MIHDKGDNYIDDNNSLGNVKRYESMIRKGATFYFDVEEYVDIVSHYVDTNKLLKAKKACEFALKIHPSSSELKLKYAQLLVSIGEPVKSLKWLRKASEIKEGNYEYYLTKGVSNILIGDIDKAEKLLLKAYKITPKSEMEEFLNVVSYAFEDSGNEITALKFLKLGVKTFPDNKDLLFRLAVNFERAGYNEQSLECYNKLLDLDPFADNIWYNLGILYNKIEQYEQAVEAYDYSLALDSAHSDALFNKANTYANWEKYNEAVECYHEYLITNEESLICHFYIGECYVQLKEYDEAVKHFNRALELHVEYPEAYYGLGLVHSDKQEYEKAEEMFKKALSLDYEHIDALFSLSAVQSKMKHFDDAIHNIQKVISVNVFDAESWLLFAYCLDSNNEPEKCISKLISAVDYNPDSPDLMYALSAHMLKNGIIDKGIVWFAKAYKMQNDYSIVEDIYPEALNLKEINKIINSEE